jgi:chaperonin GroEL (HSP60 family)
LLCAGYVKALEDALKVIDTIAFPINTDDRARPPLSRCSVASG